jgi:protein SCO1/2
MSPPPPPSRLNLTTLILLAAVAAAIGLWAGNRYFAASPQPTLQSALLYPQPRTIGDFHLLQANGRPLSLADWHGHWTLVYFGYASCPDVCPTTLATFKAVEAELNKRGIGDKLQVDFISVDPDRDSPSLLASYVNFFSPNFIAASGTDDDLTPLSKALGLIYSRTKKQDGSVEVDHSNSIVIIDPQGRVVGLFRPPLSAAAMAADLATLVASGN